MQWPHIEQEAQMNGGTMKDTSHASFNGLKHTFDDELSLINGSKNVEFQLRIGVIWPNL
tara:strand:- start:192 stop:368 length:177 start_codon:yes stop_codon:yes gene_type:complete